MRGERRPLRAGEHLVGLACQRLPPDIREERHQVGRGWNWLSGRRPEIDQTGGVESDAWISALGRYAGRLHARAGPGHHVVSPLGAWMVVAPFVFGFYASEAVAAWNLAVVGVLIAADAIWALAARPSPGAHVPH